MTSLFSERLAAHVERSGIPLRRAAVQANIPYQTAFNWVSGTKPRWHPGLSDDLRRLSTALGLNTRQADDLLTLAGCLPVQREPAMPAHSRLPKPWFASGSHPHDYEMGSESTADGNVAHIRSKEPAREGFATLMQMFDAAQWRGQRLRFSASVRATRVDQWAGLWMRVDGPNSPLGFDNMQDRPIAGTTDWRRYEVVLDVPGQASAVAFGVLLAGPGEILLRDVTMEPVPTEVPEIGGSSPYPSAPRNLDFAEV